MANKPLTFKGIVTPEISGVTILGEGIFNAFLGNKRGEVVDIEIILNKVPRTLAQNRYLWGAVYPAIQKGLLEITGEKFTAEELHMFNLQKIQKVSMECKTIAGEEVMVIQDKKSSKMSTEEFSTMIENIILFCAETWGIEIPPASGACTLTEIFTK